MAEIDANVNYSGDMAHGSSAAAGHEDALELLRDAARSLPPHAVKDLFSNGVCERCIIRLFGLHQHILTCPSVSAPVLRAILQELSEEDVADHPNNQDSTRELEEVKVCKLCLGVLQFVYLDSKEMITKEDSAVNFAATVADAVKQEGHQINSFSFEVSLPPTIVDNEQTVWSYMKIKYGSEPWYHETFPSKRIATKDFLKLSLTNRLEMLLEAGGVAYSLLDSFVTPTNMRTDCSNIFEVLQDVKSNASSFCVRLTYALPDASSNGNHISERNGCNKKRKTDDSDDLKHADVRKVAGHEFGTNSSDELKDHMIGCLPFPLEKASRYCSLIVQCYRTSIYIGGRYLKYSRNVSQTRWIIDDERMGEASVEEIVGGAILPLCQGDSYKFHAAGREDIDVRMLGSGRPFLVEIQNARQVPSEVLIKDMEAQINSMEAKSVRVKNLKELGSQGWALMREGEAEKQKQYAALVWISRPLLNNDVQTLSSLVDIKILQKTPVRVLHRRSPLEREKIIHWMKIEEIAGSSQYFILHLCTQAGTYIKEFVHGDLGRTHPSIGSILGCRAEILQLDVTDVKMDSFQA